MLDEDYLLTVTKAKKLSEIEELKLNDLNLCNEDLNPVVFNQLASIIEINFSGNKLTCIPNGIELPTLEYLDMSRNSMNDVTWLSRFPNVKDLDIDDNVALTIDDSYKIKFILKKLQFLDGKRVEDKEKIGIKFTIELVERMQNLWENHFERKWQASKAEFQKTFVLTEFSRFAMQIKYGPNSLKGYRKWRIENIAHEFMQKKLDYSDFCLEDVLTGELASKQACILNGTNLGKHKLNDSNNNNDLPKSTKVCGRSQTFKPIAFLQCHSQEKGAADFVTQVWCCMFEPDINDPSKTTNKVATCGGNTVDILDCETLKADARFEQPNEEFYTLAWTTVQLGEKHSNLLVAGGCLGFLHMIHPEQAVCYGRIKTHSAPVQTIRFMKSTQLISADKNGTINLIDIDIPTIPGYTFNWKKLATFPGLECAPLRLMVKDDCLFSGTELGLFVWQNKQFLDLDIKMVKPKSITSMHEILFPNVPNHTMVDALDMINDDIVATKCPQQGAIFLWKYSEMSNQLATKQSKSTKIRISLFAQLSWSTTKQCYINFTICKAYKTLLIGDDVGNLWVYDVSALVKKSKADRKPIPPNMIIPFPQCTRSDSTALKKFSQKTIFNDIACGADLRHVVVACDSNLVGIFQRK